MAERVTEDRGSDGRHVATVRSVVGYDSWLYWRDDTAGLMAARFGAIVSGGPELLFDVDGQGAEGPVHAALSAGYGGA